MFWLFHEIHPDSAIFTIHETTFFRSFDKFFNFVNTLELAGIEPALSPDQHFCCVRLELTEVITLPNHSALVLL